MTQAQAARTSLAELRHRIDAHNRELQEQWEIARWMRWHAVQLSPDIHSYNKPRTPLAMMRFPWEKPEVEMKPQACRVTEDEAVGLEQIVADFYKRRQEAEQTS